MIFSDNSEELQGAGWRAKFFSDLPLFLFRDLKKKTKKRGRTIMNIWRHSRNDCSVAISRNSCEEHRFLTQEQPIVPQETSINLAALPPPSSSDAMSMKPNHNRDTQTSCKLSSSCNSNFPNRLLILLFPLIIRLPIRYSSRTFFFGILRHVDVFVEVTCWFTVSALSKKGKAIPLQAWTGPEVSRRLRFPDFKTIGTWRW